MGNKPARLTKKWEPKSWKPLYDRVVLRKFLMKHMSNIDIAEAEGITPQQVSNIITSDQGQQLIQQLMLQVRDTVKFSLSENLNKAAELAAKRAVEVMESDELFEKSPFAVFDRGVKLLEGHGHLRTPTQQPSFNQQNNFLGNVPVELMEILQAGLEKSNRARELHKGRDVTDSAA